MFSALNVFPSLLQGRIGRESLLAQPSVLPLLTGSFAFIQSPRSSAPRTSSLPPTTAASSPDSPSTVSHFSSPRVKDAADRQRRFPQSTVAPSVRRFLHCQFFSSTLTVNLSCSLRLNALVQLEAAPSRALLAFSSLSPVAFTPDRSMFLSSFASFIGAYALYLLCARFHRGFRHFRRSSPKLTQHASFPPTASSRDMATIKASPFKVQSPSRLLLPRWTGSPVSVHVTARADPARRRREGQGVEPLARARDGPQGSQGRKGRSQA